jgi:uncharacterized protein (DUF1697 family)
MEDLRRAFAAAGHVDVATHIQSGNVVFTSSETNVDRLRAELARVLEAKTGYSGVVFVLSSSELERVARTNPFRELEAAGDTRCQIMFLSDEPPRERRQALMAMQGEDYQFAIKAKALYWAYPRSVEGRRRTINFEKVLGVWGTSRTTGVVNRLIELAKAAP